jgi:hypothetical protein
MLVDEVRADGALGVQVALELLFLKLFSLDINPNQVQPPHRVDEDCYSEQARGHVASDVGLATDSSNVI